MRTLLLLAVILLLSPIVGLGADTKKAAPRITYDEHVLPILKDKCVSCHSQDKKRGGLILNNYTRLMEGGSSGVSVKVGDPDGSLLYKVMAHTSEPFMPPKSPKLPQATLDVIHKWIAAGAPENSGSKVVMPNRPKVDFTLSSVTKGKPSGPPPMPPATLSREPIVKTSAETAVTAMASSPWAPLLAVGGQKQILLYNTDSLDLIGVLPFPEGTPNVIKFSGNGSLLLVGGGHAGKSGKVVIWSVTKGERLFAVGEETDAVLAADISPDQTRIALGSPGKVVRIYSTKDGKILHEIRKHTDWVTALEFSPDGVLLATGDRAGGLYVWEAFTAREYHTLKGHTGAITDVSWRADSNIVASASEDTTVRLFEMENGNQIRSWGAHGGGTQSVVFSKDGRLVSAGRDRVTKMWNGNGGSMRNFEASPDITLRAVFSHDANRVIASDWTGKIAVWNTADGKRLGTLSANPPSSKELLVKAQQILVEKQKAYDAVAAVAKVSAAALAKANADLANGQKAVNDTAAAVKVAEVKVTQTKTALAGAQAAVKSGEESVKAKQTLATALTEAAVKVKGEADKDKNNAQLQIASTRAMALSGGAAAEVLLAEKSLGDLRATVNAITPTLPVVTQALTVAQTAATNAAKQLPTYQTAQKNAQAKATADTAAMTKALSELNEAKAVVAKLQSAAAVVSQKSTK